MHDKDVHVSVITYGVDVVLTCITSCSSITYLSHCCRHENILFFKKQKNFFLIVVIY